MLLILLHIMRTFYATMPQQLKGMKSQSNMCHGGYANC